MCEARAWPHSHSDLVCLCVWVELPSCFQPHHLKHLRRGIRALCHVVAHPLRKQIPFCDGKKRSILKQFIMLTGVLHLNSLSALLTHSARFPAGREYKCEAWNANRRTAAWVPSVIRSQSRVACSSAPRAFPAEVTAGPRTKEAAPSLSAAVALGTR